MDKKSGGFTLVELIIVIAILGIIAAIAIPKLSGFKELAEERTCAYNIKRLEKEFHLYLLNLSDQPNSPLASDFLFLYEMSNKICPSNGVILYTNENGFGCSIHKKKVIPDGEIPYL